MKRVYYTIEKSRIENKWILWRNTEGSHSFGCYRAYTGDTKKEVKLKLEGIKFLDSLRYTSDKLIK